MFFIAIAFQLCRIICHYGGPGTPGENETKQDTPASGFCWWLKCNGGKHKHNKENSEIVKDARKLVEVEANTEKAKFTLMSPRHNQGKIII
jgi:hypothetical protein